MIAQPFVDIPPTGYGGIESVVHHLVEALLKKGVKVTLFATGSSQTNAELRSYFKTRPQSFDVLSELDHVQWSFSQIAHETYDVVHIHASLPALSFAAYSKLPVLFTIHNAGNANPHFSRAYRRHPEVLYVANCPAQRGTFARLLRGASIHTQTIPLGLDPAQFSIARRKGSYVAFLGQYGWHKGLHLAIDAARQAKVEFRMAGKPLSDMDREYMARDVLPRLGPDTIDVGEVNHQAKVRFLGAAQALICPFLADESFGLVALEAMLCGTPVVAYSRGAMPLLIRPNVTGFIARTVNGLAAGIRQARRIDAAHCREQAAKHFSADRMADRYLRLYQEMVCAL